MEAIIEFLMAHRDLLITAANEIDALIVGLSTPDTVEPVEDKKVIDLKEIKDCKHEHTQEIAGAGPTAVRKVCVDCMKEL